MPKALQENIVANVRQRECPECGEYFSPAHGKQIYCSIDCRDDQYKKMRPHRHQLMQGVPHSQKEALTTSRSFYVDHERCFKCGTNAKWAESAQCMQCNPHKKLGV